MIPMTAHLGDSVWIARRPDTWYVMQGDGDVVGEVQGCLLEDARFDTTVAGMPIIEGTLRGWHAHAMGRSCYPSLYGTPVTYDRTDNVFHLQPSPHSPIDGARFVELGSRGQYEIAADCPT